ncbi:MAG: pantetheine-phosphate adenylyltransferase [Christensenellaceae bacterium]|nr:pantetheine-phosphate adenylyltransferase [Christensenellaceae bacterium]
MSIAVFAGSFDPFTMGHLDIVQRAAPHFEKFYIAIFKNPGKQNDRFRLDERMQQIGDAVQGLRNVYVTEFSGLVVDYCRSIGADCLVRGIRNGSDVDYERQLESVNRKLAPEIETMFLLSKPEFAHISSSLVKQLMDINISIDGLVPDAEHIIFTKRRDSYGQ